LIQEQSSLTKNKHLKSQTTVTYHDLSNAGYLITSTSRTATKAHSFMATVTRKYGSTYSDVEYTLIETTLNRTTNKFTTTALGTKTARIDSNGNFVSSSDGNATVMFKGSTFSSDDEDLFKQVASLTSVALGSKSGLAYASEISEGNGKSYYIEEKVEEITVESEPNTEYIVYSFLGKPFVILGTGVWNILKCAGYAIINAGAGYNMTLGSERADLPIWMMPSMSTAREKFEEAKEANEIPYYPEYHIPFTNNRITVVTTEQHSNEAFITKKNAVVVSRVSRDYTNTMSVQRSAQADAAYTAGVAGLIGTGVTIPVAGLSWVAGFAAGIAVKVAEAQGY
ncbi:MAG: hypothetical protein IIT68_03640, partial [Treponema sp.]|nr:hypothetical protein [Treponema sp.]